VTGKTSKKMFVRKSAANTDPAFTLIELLVVVAIIAVLASLLLPAISKAGQAAKGIKCRSNARQMGLGLQLYLADTGIYPNGESDGTARRPGWVAVVAQYLSSENNLEFTTPGDASVVKKNSTTVFRCPSRPPPSPNFLDSIPYGYNYRSFANQGLGRAGWLENGRRQYSDVRESEVAVPSDMIALGDSFVRVKQSLLASDLILERSSEMDLPVTPEEHKWAYKLHSGRANIGFSDGHVEAIKLNELFFDDRDEALRRWNRDNQPHRDKLN
jgi:prepilin-type N-terminal cleavage/methylation domain-containing protein/prepilin-type processing-associated H-X9-DG protein